MCSRSKCILHMLPFFVSLRHNTVTMEPWDTNSEMVTDWL